MSVVWKPKTISGEVGRGHALPIEPRPQFVAHDLSCSGELQFAGVSAKPRLSGNAFRSPPKFTRIRPAFFDKHTVSRFIDHAQSILDAAESAGSSSAMTILMGPTGIRMIADSDWPLDSLLSHHGANTAYRVTENRGAVRVEGREGSRRCVLESVSHAATARMLLAAR
jgi:hypothetical protein